MLPQTFFEKFDRIASAPGAISSVRKMVLRFAVQGKLVPQDPDDEPANCLVQRIATTLPRKKSENPFVADIDATVISETEYELPSGWKWLPLGHLGLWATGCGFPRQYQGNVDGDLLFCKVSDMNLIGNEIEIRTTANLIDVDIAKQIRARPNPVGTVIFPKIGGAIATHKRRILVRPTIIDNNCSGIKPIGLSYTPWLLILLFSIDMTKYQSGTSVPAVSQSSLDPIRIGLPPLAEQKRIVTKVDELMALCDQLEAQQQERDKRHSVLAHASLARFTGDPTPENLQFLFHKSYDINPVDLRRTILDLAIKGALVDQRTEEGVAEDLVSEAISVRAQLIQEGKLKRPRVIKPIAEFEHYEIPNNWTWTSLDAITEISPRNTIEDSTSVSFLPMPAIPQNYGGTVEGEVRAWSEVKKGFTHLADGDVVLGKITPCFQNGKSAVIDGLENGFGAGTTELHVVRPFLPILDPFYIWIFFQSPQFLTEGILYMTGSAGQKRVPKGYVACKPFPLPPPRRAKANSSKSR